MGLLLIAAGAALNYFGWRLLTRLHDKRVNRHFRSWWTKGETEEESEGLRVVAGSILVTFMIGVGILLILGGVADLFS